MKLLPDDAILTVMRKHGDGCVVVDKDFCLLFRGRQFRRVRFEFFLVGWVEGREVVAERSH